MSSLSAIPSALAYALEKYADMAVSPICLFNPSGFPQMQGDVFSYHHKCTINTPGYNYNTSLVYSTRQTDETLGFLALAVSHTRADGHIIMAQDNKHGADSLEKRVKQGFPNLITLTKHKCRIWVLKKSDFNEEILPQWLSAAMLQPVMNGEYMSAPGLFSWDRVDKASSLLLDNLPQNLSGIGADLGCGYGYLSANLLKYTGITTLYSIDNDARAVDACEKNVAKRKPAFIHHAIQHDATTYIPPEKLDFIVMNPPFHTQTDETHELGQSFCENALKMLKIGGTLYLVANRHLPYEAILKAGAKDVTLLADKGGFKVIKAIK